MKIAQLVSNFRKVSSRENYAIYNHVGVLCDLLDRDGHDVTLFGSKNSEVKSKHVFVDEGQDLYLEINSNNQQRYLNLLISKCYESADNFDVIHSHFSLKSSFFSNLVKTPTLISVHSPLDGSAVYFMKKFDNLKYVSFSYAQRRQAPELNWYANIYHGVDTELFGFNEKPEDYAFFLGRITKEKGVHLAIEACKKAGIKLIIAGRTYKEEGYFHEFIEPHIDGVNIRYIGEQGLDQKIEFLKKAKVLVFPTQYDEVFGYVMIEAMACGTPVVAWKKGSVLEVVKDGETGFIVESVDAMAEAILKIDTIDRLKTRERAKKFFSIEKMVTGYQNVYARIIKENKSSKKE